MIENKDLTDMEKEIKENEKEIKQLKDDMILIFKACLIGVVILSIVALCNVFRIFIRYFL